MSCQECTETVESAMELDLQRRAQLIELCELARDGLKASIGNEPVFRVFDAIFEKAHKYARMVALPEDNPPS